MITYYDWREYQMVTDLAGKLTVKIEPFEIIPISARLSLLVVGRRKVDPL